MGEAFDRRVSNAASTIAVATAERDDKGAGVDSPGRPTDHIRSDHPDADRLHRCAALAVDLCARALGIWPRLDQARLTRTKGDPVRIARLMTRRTSLTFDCIVAILMKGEFARTDVTPDRPPAAAEQVDTPDPDVIRPTRSTRMEEQIDEGSVAIRLSASRFELILTEPSVPP